MNFISVFAWAGRINRTQLGEVIEHQKEIFKSSLERYEDQSNYFSELQSNPEMKKQFIKKLTEGAAATNSEDVLELAIQASVAYLVVESHNIINDSNILNRLQEILLTSSDEVLLHEVSRVFNRFLKSRSYYLDSRNKNAQAEFQAKGGLITPCTFSGLRKTTSPYNQYLIEEATLKFQDRELLLRNLYPFISEAYLDIESLFQLEGDLYLNWMLMHEESELINPNAAALFHAYRIDNKIATDQVKSKYFKNKNQKTTMMIFSSPHEFMRYLRDYKQLPVADESMRKSVEKNFKQSRKQYPFTFPHIQSIREHGFDVLTEFIGIPESIVYDLGLSDRPVQTVTTPFFIDTQPHGQESKEKLNHQNKKNKKKKNQEKFKLQQQSFSQVIGSSESCSSLLMDQVKELPQAESLSDSNVIDLSFEVENLLIPDDSSSDIKNTESGIIESENVEAIDEFQPWKEFSQTLPATAGVLSFSSSSKSVPYLHLSTQTQTFIRKLFQLEEWEGQAVSIEWDEMEKAYGHLKIALEGKTGKDTKPLNRGGSVRTLVAMNPSGLERGENFHKFHGLVDRFLPKALERLRRTFVKFGWTPDRLLKIQWEPKDEYIQIIDNYSSLRDLF